LSFSSSVKNELCRYEAKGMCCKLSELAAAIRLSGTIKVLNQDDVYLKLSTENAAFARRIFSLLKSLYGVNAEISVRRSKKLKKHVLYILVLTSSMGLNKILRDVKIESVDASEIDYIDYEVDKIKKCCKKAYLKSAFLAAGSMSDPEKTYHLEIISHRKSIAQEVNHLMTYFGLNSKIIKRKAYYVVYLKEGENIVDFLNIIGAHSALLELENVRIMKEMRNNVNRIVNCETANLQKTVDASIRQVDNIKYIRDNLGFDKLPDNLRQIAELRLEYSDASLKELGEMLSPRLGKSGVNHRLRKLDEIAENTRSLKGEL